MPVVGTGVGLGVGEPVVVDAGSLGVASDELPVPVEDGPDGVATVGEL
jgi:hypothetical protein